MSIPNSSAYDATMIKATAQPFSALSTSRTTCSRNLNRVARLYKTYMNMQNSYNIQSQQAAGRGICVRGCVKNNYANLKTSRQWVGALSHYLTKTTFTRRSLMSKTSKFHPRIACEDDILGCWFSLVQGCPSPIIHLRMMQLW